MQKSFIHDVWNGPKYVTDFEHFRQFDTAQNSEVSHKIFCYIYWKNPICKT